MIAFELALWAVCWAATFAVGGVHPVTQVALAVAVLALFVALGISRARRGGVRISTVTWVMLGAFAWMCLQRLPLPIGLLSRVSPLAGALWSDVGARFAPITIEPVATSLELMKGLAYLGVFVCGTEVLREERATRRAAAALALLGLAVSITIGVHRVLGHPFLFGLYTPEGAPGSGYFPPFVNGGHAGSFLALASLCAFGLATATDRGARFAWLVIGTICTVSLLTTMSRGAALALAIGGFVLAARVATARLGRVRGIAIATMMLAVLGSGAFAMSNGLRTRVLHTPTDNPFASQRTRGWTVATRVAEHYPLVGAGRGAFESAATAYRIETEGVDLDYAENFVLQVVAEWGFPVAIALLVAAILALYDALRHLPTDPVVDGLLGGCVAVTAHGLLDCGFEMPGVMLPFVLALAAIVARAEVEHRRRKPRRRIRLPSVAAAAIVGSLLVWMGAQASPHTVRAELKRVRLDAAAHRAVSVAEAERLVEQHPASIALQMIAAQAAINEHDAHALHHLSRAMRLMPAAPRPHELAAVELLNLRRPSQAALEFKLAFERGATVHADVLVRTLGSYALAAGPSTISDQIDLGRAFATRKRWDDADQAFSRAIELGGGSAASLAWLAAFRDAPAARRRAIAKLMLANPKSGEELAMAMREVIGQGDLDDADKAFSSGRMKFPESSYVVAEGARLRAARNDFTGALALVSKIAPFNLAGRVMLTDLAVDFAQRAGEPETAAAATVRLRLLRKQADLEHAAPPQ